MKRINVVEWYRTAAFVYAMGIWTTIGCLIHYTHPEWFQFKDGLDPNEVVPDHLVKEVHRWGNITTVTYRRKDFVPYHTRFYNYIQSLKGGSETKADTKADEE